MIRRRLALYVLAAMAGGCSGNAPPPQPVDPALLQTQRLARLAYEQDRPDQAATLYRQALDRAWRRDDLQAIGDAGYNLAIVELDRGQPAAALEVARATGDEMARRSAAVPADLQLVEAVALYHIGDGATAEDLARRTAARHDASVETVARATFLTGLVADDRGDAVALAAALAALGEPADTALAADRDELAGRLALRQGDPATAEAAFLQAAERRRNRLDDRGMARALSLAGQAAEAQGETSVAAGLYLRAGRSAALSAEPDDANRWLERARQLALRSATLSIVREAEGRLDALSTAGKR